jgi:hypothetical protein
VEISVAVTSDNSQAVNTSPFYKVDRAPHITLHHTSSEPVTNPPKIEEK